MSPGTQALMRIELLGLFKIRRLVIVGKLDLEDAAGQLQCRSPRLKLESRIDHLNPGLKGLVIHRNIGEVHVERGSSGFLTMASRRTLTALGVSLFAS